MTARRTALKEAEALVAREPRDDDARRLVASAHFLLALGLGKPESAGAKQ